jgi:hypothetical protein
MQIVPVMCSFIKDPDPVSIFKKNIRVVCVERLARFDVC